MNQSDFDAGQGPTTPEELRTAQLCAYLFDELDAPERAELETALAGDAELNAELESLRATIGLVRSEHAAGASSEPRLSPAAMATLTAKAAGPKLSPVAPALKRGTLLQGIFNNAGRLAAASLMITGGTLAFLQNRTLSHDEESASFRYDIGGEVRYRESNTQNLSRTAEQVTVDPRSQSTAKGGINPSSQSQGKDRAAWKGDRIPADVAKARDLDNVGGRRSGLAVLGHAGGEIPASGETEVQIPWTAEITPPDATRWAKLTDRKVKRPAGGGGGRIFQAPSGGGGGGGGSYRGPGDSTPASAGSSGPSTPDPGAPSRDRQANRDSLGLPSVQLEIREAITAGRSLPSTLSVNGAAALPPESMDALTSLRGSQAERPSVSADKRAYLGKARAPAQGEIAQNKSKDTEQLERLKALGYLAGGEDVSGEDAGGSHAGGVSGAGPPPAGFFDVQVDPDLVATALGGFSPQRASLEERARKLADQWIAHCQPGRNERPRDMYFRFWGDNPYVFSSHDKLATFAADVDTASYALARRYLVDGVLPTKAQIRTEEFVNSFKPDVPAPVEETFAITTELAPSPFGGSEARWMLRVTVRGKEISREERQPLAITFVVDTSGSMKEGKRLELVKHALRLLVSQLDARDSIALVAFSNEARLILPMTSAAQRGVIEAAIFPLKPNGGTNAEAGLKLGYELAATGLAKGVHNRVVFLSDGVANMGQTDQDQLSADVKHRRDQGIYLNTIGVGMNNHNDVFLERLADQGDGICDYVDDAAAVERAIVERFTGAFLPIASDVKIQVEFDPKRVLRWRQIGYENRAVADADFRNDAVDAGEIGAGHQVTALFEIERVGSFTSNMLPEEGPLATVRLRWKEPKGAGKDPREARVTEIEHTFFSKNSLGAFDSASAGFQRAVLVAQFSEVLRRSNHAQGDPYHRLISEMQRVRSLPAWASDADTQELLALVIRAANLGAGVVQQRGDLANVVEEYRRHQYLRCQLDRLQGQVASQELRELQSVNDRLELRIRDLCLQELR